MTEAVGALALRAAAQRFVLRIRKAWGTLPGSPEVRGAAVAGVLAALLYLITREPGRQPYDVYVWLADSFLQGRLDIPQAPAWLERVQFEGRWYSHKAPLPAVVLMPVVAIVGTEVDLRIVTPLVGGVAAGLAWSLAGRLGLHGPRRVAAWLLPVAGSTIWFEAKAGSMWGLGAIGSVLFLLAALNEYFGERRPVLIGLFVALAAGCRPSAVLAGAGFALVMGPRAWVPLGAGAVVPVALYAAYNMARFGTPFDYSMHLYYQQDSYRVARPPGVFSVAHIPHNLYSWLFMAPSFQQDFPWLRLNMMGQGIFLTSPALLASLGARRERWLWIALLAVTLPAAVFYANGFAQFGMRYLLDTVPFFFALVCVALRDDRAPGYAVLLTASVAMNAYGVWYTTVYGLLP